MGDLRRQRRKYRDRPTIFLRAAGRFGLNRIIAQAEARGVEVVFLTGPPISTVELQDWLREPLPAWWHHGAHYLSLPHPVLRFEQRLDGVPLRRVEVHRAAAYFGEGDYSPDDAGRAWRRLGALIGGQFDEGRLLSTPATTGRYLLARSIPQGREWPTLELETQDFLRATTGQARVQMFGRTGRRERLEEWDGRLMYGALCSNLGAGEPVRDAVDKYEGYGRQGRYLVRFTVPRDWRRRCDCGTPGHDGIGLLGVRDEGSGWRWPAAPGETATTWADGIEVAIALEHGWRLQILERLLYPMPAYPIVRRHNGQANRRGPLDAWAGGLLKIRGRPHAAGAELLEGLVDAGVRSILLFGLGSLHGTPRRVTHVVTMEEAQAGAIPRSASNVLPLGAELMVWTEPEAHTWAEMSHPEWTAGVWARARARLLSAPMGNGRRAGMLYVPAVDVVAARTDALWLTCSPAWVDDGAAGRFRRVFSHGEPFELPSTEAGLFRLRSAVSRG